jgi:hypothetical protein
MYLNKNNVLLVKRKFGKTGTIRRLQLIFVFYSTNLYHLSAILNISIYVSIYNAKILDLSKCQSFRETQLYKNVSQFFL